MSSTLLCHCIFSRLLSVSFELLFIFSCILLSPLLFSSNLLSSSLVFSLDLLFSFFSYFLYFFTLFLLSSHLIWSCHLSPLFLSSLISYPLIPSHNCPYSSSVRLYLPSALPHSLLRPSFFLSPFLFSHSLYTSLSLCVTHIPWIMINVGVY